MRIFGQDLNKNELRQRIGSISQIAGAKRYILKEGRSEGVEAVDVKTGSGLYYTVLPGRAMDIAWMEYQGKPVAYISKGDITGAQYYSPDGFEWLRNFNAGALTTCGLTHVGPPEQDGIWKSGLHGRISNTPAEEVTAQTQWQGEDLWMTIKGKMREAALFDNNLVLNREIKSKLGENRIFIQDEVINEGFVESPFMIVYHMNFGYPIVSELSRLITPDIKVQARDEEAEKGIDQYKEFQAPVPGFAEQVFFHDLACDEQGNTLVGIVNEQLKLGIYIRFNVKELPCFSQWKLMGSQEYVTGLEPGNCIPEGRISAREKGTLAILQPGERYSIRLELGILDGINEITAFEKEVNALL